MTSKILISAIIIYALAVLMLPKPSSFESDGCTLWPDKNYNHCCVHHDKTYWLGGASEERLNADVELQQCVAGTDNITVSWIMYYGVRIGGHPILPTPWRWGFGQEYSFCYR